MELGQVNIFRRSLSKFKEIISQRYRREVLSEVICKEVSKLKNISKNKKIKFLDYGSSFEAYCYDFYNKNHIKYLNKKKNIIFKKINNLNDKKNFDFCLIIDVLHHIGLDNDEKIFKLIKKLKAKSKFLIIKDHFQYGFFSNKLLIVMDLFSNYGDGTKIPKIYFSTKSFKKFIIKNKLNEIKRINNRKYYKWYWPFVNSSKIQFISILK